MKLKEIAFVGSLVLGAIGANGCADLAYQRMLIAKSGEPLSSGHRDRFSTPNSTIRVESQYDSRNFYGRGNRPSFRGRGKNHSSIKWRRYEQEKRVYNNKIRQLRRDKETYNIDAHGRINLPYGQGRPFQIEPPKKPSPRKFHRR